MKQVNWGIIGLGSAALQFANSFNFVKNAKLLAIASKNPDKIKIYKKNYNISENFCFNSYEDLINNQCIDIIYIAVPTALHFDSIVKCLKKKKRVLVEKPATLNSTQALSIKNEYMEIDSFFTEAFMYLYHPKIKKVIELIKSGEVGDLIAMESFFGNDVLTKKSFFGYKKRKKINIKNRLYNKEMGGGVILDLGCYPISFSTLIASLNSKINYDNIVIFNKQKEIGSTGVDLDSYVGLKFENNFTSKIGVSFTRNLGKQTKIIGTKGELVIHDTWTSENSEIVIKKNNKTEIINIIGNQNIYSHEIETISQCIIEEKKEVDYPGLTIDQTIGNMKIIDKWLS